MYGQQLSILGICWAIAFMASLCRSYSDADNRGHLRRLGASGTSGFFALGVIGIGWGSSLDNAATSSSSFAFCVAVAALVGVIGQQQDQYIRLFFEKVVKVFTTTKSDSE